MELAYKTNRNSDPQGKARVYFTCHPLDFDIYFDEISDDILKHKNLDCAIYYKKDLTAKFTKEEMVEEFKNMKLFVVPVTDRFLTDKNTACDMECSFALERHIPILFLMQEEEKKLEDKFEEKFGGVQYLDKFKDSDPTAIRFEKKLQDFLFSVLVSDELANEVRDAFVAYIFLSYRKYDRKYANDLMEWIHRNEFCRDIAIWYDEFLVPGEEFNQAIHKAINNSELFILLVTPTILKPTNNYVIREEYPDATALNKPVITAEMENTDWEQLKKYFEDIPEPINARDENVLTNVLREKMRDLALDENRNDARHLYLIGLAYQNGIDVEVDPNRAVSLLTISAERDEPEAMDKLAQMYHLGDGIDKDEKKCAYWLEKLVPRREYFARLEPSEDNIYKFFDAMRRLLHSGFDDQRLVKFCEIWLATGEYLFYNYEDHKYKEELAEAYGYVADIFEESEDFAGAQECYLKRLNLWEKDLIRKDTGTALELLTDYYYDLAVAYHKDECFSKAKNMYLKKAATDEKLRNKNCNLPMRSTLAKNYYDLAVVCHKGYYFYDQEHDQVTPKSDSLECLQLYEILCQVFGPEGFQSIVDNYQRYGIPDYRKESFAEAKEWCSKSLNLYEELYQERKERSDERDIRWLKEALADIYFERGIIEYKIGNFADAEKWCLRSWELYKELTAFNDEYYHIDLADICHALSAICFVMGDLDKAKGWNEKYIDAIER